MQAPLVSVIVPTKNSSNYLERCLESIKNQSYKNIEIIVVDNHSDDNTQEIAAKFTNLVFTKGPERSTQRNFGAEQSNGDIVYFVDSDFLLEKDVVKEGVEKYLEGCELIAVHNTSDPTVSIWAKVRKFERDMYKYDENNIAVRFIDKKAFLGVNGYNVDLIAAEDYDLHNRLLKEGYKLGFIDSEEIHLGEPKSIKEVYSKHFFYGKTLYQYIQENKDKANTQLNPVRSGFVKNKKKFLKQPVLSLLFLFYMIVKYGAGALGMAHYFLFKKV